MLQIDHDTMFTGFKIFLALLKFGQDIFDLLKKPLLVFCHV